MPPPRRALGPLAAAVAVVVALAASRGTAVGVAPSSPCAVQCGNDLSSTSGADLVCGDASYGSQAGQTFETCVGCELDSAYVDAATGESDLHWLLYNLRAAAAWCLFGYPNSTASLSDSPCVTSFACGAFAAALEDGGPTASPYGYCDSWPASTLEPCRDCLAQLGSERFMSNFFTALEAGCEQRPAAASTLALAGSLFASAPVNITTPVASSSSAAAAAAAAAASPSRGLSLGGEVGIGVGSALAVALAVGIGIIWRGKRRRRTALARLAAAAAATAVSPSESRRPFMAPNSARTPVWTDDSPQSARGETSAMLASSVATFSPYQSPYQSPVSPDPARAKGKDREPVDAGFEMARLAAAADAPPIIRPPPAPTIPRRASTSPPAPGLARQDSG